MFKKFKANQVKSFIPIYQLNNLAFNLHTQSKLKHFKSLNYYNILSFINKNFSNSTLSTSSLAEQIKSKLSTLQTTRLVIKDTSGGCGASFSIDIATQSFKGKTLLQQHRMLNELLENELKVIHSITYKTSIN